VLSFFQGNRHLLGPLVERVRAWSAGDGPVLDLYAGVGLFALALAGGASDVVAAGLTNVRILRTGVEAALGVLPAARAERVVLDPPRAGAGPDVVRGIVARHPASVVYVSCDPPTLGRDLAQFAQAGYVVDRAAAFDLFPDTFHLETVVRLVPR
jgi:23S rRNA (uracil1939-C5)-methyltransferase